MNDDEIVAVLWGRFRQRALAHVDVLEAWSAGEASEGSALEAAHKLAGSLGSYGRPEGSRAAVELERRLRGIPGDPEATHLQSLGIDELLASLRRSVGEPT